MATLDPWPNLPHLVAPSIDSLLASAPATTVGQSQEAQIDARTPARPALIATALVAIAIAAAVAISGLVYGLTNDVWSVILGSAGLLLVAFHRLIGVTRLL